MKIAVITASIDAYDALLVPPPQTRDADYFCFTDVDSLDVPPPWQKVLVERPPTMSPRMFSRRIKCLPWEYIDHTYDVSIWIDAAGTILSEGFVDWALNRALAAKVNGTGTKDWPTQIPFAVWQHPNRNSIYTEQEHIADIDLKKYRGQPLKEQVAHYLAEGHPLDYGLYACGTICRLHTVANLIVGRAWLSEQQHWGVDMDQTSLPVVFWRLGLAPVVFEEYQLSNEFVRFVNHERDD